MPGGSVIFNVVVEGTPPFTYRWERQNLNGNVVTVPNATGTSLTLTT